MGRKSSGRRKQEQQERLQARGSTSKQKRKREKRREKRGGGVLSRDDMGMGVALRRTCSRSYCYVFCILYSDCCHSLLPLLFPLLSFVAFLLLLNDCFIRYREISYKMPHLLLPLSAKLCFLHVLAPAPAAAADADAAGFVLCALILTQ